MSDHAQISRSGSEGVKQVKPEKTFVMAALADEVDYTVYYMSAFSGRAETLHIMLADACAQWTTGSKDDLLSSQAGTCVFQVPAVKDHANGLVFSQTTTAVKYLAKKLAGGGEFARVTRKALPCLI